MKRLFGIIICLILISACVAAPLVFAEEEQSTVAEEVIHFINPTALTVMGNNLYVADNVEDNKSAILCFDIEQNAPVYRDTYEVDGKITKLSNNGQDCIYAVRSNDALEINVNDAEQENKTYTVNQGETIVGFAYGRLGTDGYTQYALTANLWRNFDGNFQPLTSAPLTATKDCLALDNDIYYLYEENSNVVCKCYDGRVSGYNSSFNAGFSMTTGFAPTGLFVWNNLLAMYSATSIRYVDTGKQSYPLAPLLDLYADNDSQNGIRSVDSAENRLYVLNNKNQVEIYERNGQNNEFMQ
ncbi:MAG: hypothetical protein NC332_05770, partial [Firmicutes bacterium]|nr:hypothetical protein [Bacillota bacterium]